MFRYLAAIILISIAVTTSALAADTKPHRVAIQVDQNDPQVMNLALNNATNVIEYYRGRNEDVDVDIVTYGPGLHMLRSDTSPVQDRLKRRRQMGGHDGVSRAVPRPPLLNRTSRPWNADGLAGFAGRTKISGEPE